MNAKLCTDSGRIRRLNQDAGLVDPRGLYAVADGMGGHLAGEVASRIAVDTLQEALGEAEVSVRALTNAVRLANQRICEEADYNLEYRGMGTTLTALWFGADQVLIGHVGDSRAYLFREGRLRRCTRDHSMVDDLVRSGMITREQAKRHPQRNVITRALGIEPSVIVDIFEWDRCPGDRWLICSDGLTNMVDEETIWALLKDEPFEKVAEELLALALENGGTDNITVITLLDDLEVSA